MKKEMIDQVQNTKDDNNLSAKDAFKIKKLLDQIESNLVKVRRMLSNNFGSEDAYKIDTKEAEEYVEGVFDGRFMMDDKNKKYLVPENYASKSKLVEGDKLKLVIASDGTYVYKQIFPVDREKKTGELYVEGDNYIVKTNDGEYNVLKASITYFKIKVGDKLTIIVPKDKKAKWAAVENKII